MRLVRSNDMDFESLWCSLIAKGGHLDAQYGAKNLAYYKEYCGGSVAQDISLLVAEKSTPFCGFRAFIRELGGGKSEVSCFSLPLQYVECSLSDDTKLFLAQRILRHELEKLLQVQKTETKLYFKDLLKGGRLSPVGRLLLEYGGRATPNFSQIIDLSQSELDLHKHLTKSNKWSINWAKKNLVITLLEPASVTREDFEQFRRLHLEAAGRETRSQKSWDLQHEMVRNGEAFGVFACMDGSPVSAALFPHSKSHCFYGVSASNRNLFDMPLNHGVIWAALLHAKSLGIRYFEMGEQLFPQVPRQNPSHKELGISFFKRAFGGSTQVSLEISLEHVGDNSGAPRKT